ncbi:hypothetical protein [Salmonella enterica]|uniref:hypothetical protein n=1 Tax=Salmonella enterica TaxID=28901 RepID=UPI0011BE88F0|nr:hypothetical protein [Salmonella enterica]TXC13995.1 hypothetical protein DP148_26895 [Salmonella enterica subsp. enterica serovar Typhimurium]
MESIYDAIAAFSQFIQYQRKAPGQRHANALGEDGFELGLQGNLPKQLITHIVYENETSDMAFFSVESPTGFLYETMSNKHYVNKLGDILDRKMAQVAPEIKTN